MNNQILDALTTCTKLQEKLDSFVGNLTVMQFAEYIDQASVLIFSALDEIEHISENESQQVNKFLDDINISLAEMKRSIQSSNQPNIAFLNLQIQQIQSSIRIVIMLLNDLLVTPSSYILSSFAPLLPTDTEADFIINDEPVKIIRMAGMNGSIQAVIKRREEMILDAEEVTDVFILHLGTIKKFLDVMEGKA
ncbi:hypothetical protein QR665_12170 [Acinetobacter gerneri]|uniref:hypothetical protein n=1 Tax=Acinetobacter gerneri TaxID=202952 RepID=UPI002935CE56|nr:hypothetical protein [Acinetobacter gerneri]MDV2440218.1 hypothetical protein [Acinetobacter gerneri]